MHTSASQPTTVSTLPMYSSLILKGNHCTHPHPLLIHLCSNSITLWYPHSHPFTVLERTSTLLTSHPTHLSPLTTHHSPLTTHHSPLTSHLSPLTSHLSPHQSHQWLANIHQQIWRFHTQQCDGHSSLCWSLWRWCFLPSQWISFVWDCLQTGTVHRWGEGGQRGWCEKREDKKSNGEVAFKMEWWLTSYYRLQRQDYLALAPWYSRALFVFGLWWLQHRWYVLSLIQREWNEEWEGESRGNVDGQWRWIAVCHLSSLDSHQISTRWAWLWGQRDAPISQSFYFSTIGLWCGTPTHPPASRTRGAWPWISSGGCWPSHSSSLWSWFEATVVWTKGVCLSLSPIYLICRF